MTVEKAVEMIRSRRGAAYDPKVTDTLIELLPRLEKQIQRDPSANRRQLVRPLLHQESSFGQRRSDLANPRRTYRKSEAKS